MDSPYINDIDLQPPSPSDAQATFDSFDFNGTSYAQQSPNSYNGSYNGSPYSGHSELSFGDDNLNAINNQGPSSYGLFDDGNDVLQQQQRNAGGALGLRDYDPSDFDPPNSSSSLLMFDNDYMTPYELPASMPHHHSQDHRIPFDYSSPSSNGGDSANEDARSRASSVSSNPHTPGHALSSPPPPHISPSPRLGVAQNLENLSFNSPSWGTVPLPQQHHEHGNNGNSNNFRENKAQSPPRLLMPDSSLQAPPIINAPDGDGHDGHHGPSLNIVPATPISGMAHAAQFQNRLETVSQEESWQDDSGSAGFQFPQQRGSGLHSQGILNPTSPAHQTTDLPGLEDDNNNDNDINRASGSKGTLTDGFLFPSNMNMVNGAPAGPSGLGGLGMNGTRSRSKSDTALEPPNWDHGTFAGGRAGSAVADDQFSQTHQQALHHHQGGPGHSTPSFNFASLPPHPSTSASPSPHIGTTGLPNDNSQSPNHNVKNHYLSPEMSSLRRSRSDTGGGRPGHIRQARSEDLRAIGGLGVGDALGGFGNGSQAFGPSSSPQLGGHHGHSQSFSGGTASNFLFPPSSQQDFLQRQQQYLTPSGMIGGMGIGGEGLPSMGGHGQPSKHYRRASSGSRSERGISSYSNTLGVDDALGGGMGMGGGVGGALGAGGWSGTNSARASPYPSPNVSPRVRYDDLPGNGLDVGGLGVGGVGSSPAMGGVALPSVGGIPGMGNNIGNAAGGVVGVATVGGIVAPSVPPGVQVAVTVSKPNVTTGRTANASHKRRKQEATFVCPVPGCGSTFTRSFNLKGHIRSHNEEKPFQCHWPGCGKGFARQHDCKRHEQLHTNYRPFTCDGCGKQFARMDALNRHLRSEGGADCQRTLESNGTLPPGIGGGGGVTKKEETWSAAVGVAL